MDNLLKLFAAHSSAPATIQRRFIHSYTDNLSVVELIKAPDNPIPMSSHAHEEYEFIVPHTPMPFLMNEGAVYFGEVGYVFPFKAAALTARSMRFRMFHTVIS